MNALAWAGRAALAGHLTTPPMTGLLMTASAAREAAEREALAVWGQALGLDEHEVHAVIDTWIAWHQTQPTGLSWQVVRDDLVRRASSEPWGPDAARRRHLDDLAASLRPHEPTGAARAARRARLRRIHTAYHARRRRWR